MEVDETPNRVYIHNLQDEIAEIEAQEQAENQIGIFPPNVAKIPQHLLRDKPDDNHNQQLILYSVPKSLTEDEGHDSVRKAIIEARQRAREKANLEASRAKETETEPGADEDEMDLS
ncbi:hypothetical protein K470DRAFT_265561 [Piedraia hortae CBS 480.64]|uniref:Uncharacterized protein n=1 Tax=Piedraia hortae CBS 480.64 TaxID=1314780 RepID=A0A6A7BV90_9PEZI|nr:hypothetical protein K470DRAFT_265561 [Piedraia hortae CBS 480.64]